jgi:RNA polymerase sigma-70 factor (ECF subfamily)
MLGTSTTKANPPRGGGAKPTGLSPEEAAGPPKEVFMPRRTRAAAAGERGDYSHLADEKLISLMGAGDAGAFAALYDRHSRAVYSFSYRMAGEKRAAEDLAQYAFLKVWRSAGTYRAQRGGVKTWLLTVVHNRGIDLLRSSASRRRTREEAEAEAPRSQPSEAFSEAWGNHRRDRLREALRDTPHEQREAVMLVHFSGLTQTEVSERLRLPLGTVKGRVRLGLRKLRVHPALREMAVG